MNSALLFALMTTVPSFWVLQEQDPDNKTVWVDIKYYQTREECERIKSADKKPMRNSAYRCAERKRQS